MRTAEAIEVADRPLADVRVLAVEQHGAGPFATLQLADLGADVIKIENPNDGGDVARAIEPYAVAGDSLFFQSLNRGKRSVALDLGNPAGRRAFRRLAANADAVLANVRGDVPDRLGIRYEHLRDVNPRIVCCFLSGFGMHGPRRADPAYDPVIQALTGWMALTGGPADPPTKSGLSLVDFSSGYVAAIAVLAGVHAARRDGVGLECDLGLFDVGIALLTYLGTWQLSRGYQVSRHGRSAHASIAPFQLFQASDGWVVVGAVKDAHWRRLAEAVGRPDLLQDARFRGPAERLRHRGELEGELDLALGRRSVADWCRLLAERGIACAPVQGLAAALADRQVAERGLVVEYEHPELGTVRGPGTPLKVGSQRPGPRRAPGLGADTEAALREVAGASPEEIEELRAEGAFGPRPPVPAP